MLLTTWLGFASRSPPSRAQNAERGVRNAKKTLPLRTPRRGTHSVGRFRAALIVERLEDRTLL